jgi:hypothetical protein
MKPTSTEENPMSGIQSVSNRPNNVSHIQPVETRKSKSFGSVMSKVADGALDTVGAVGSVIPGGGLVSAAAKGIKALKNGAEGNDTRSQLDQMWEMQRQNQQFNLEYLQMQNELQAENRRYSTVSNLMKAQHDTAKAAINNMHV